MPEQMITDDLQLPIDEITGQIVDAAFQVHRRLGPGLLESVCEGVLAKELELRGLKVGRHIAVSVDIDGLRFAPGFPIPARDIPC